MRFGLSCSGGKRPSLPWNHKEPPLEPVVLPRDELRHPHTMEWWYFIAHLTTECGARVSLVCSAIRKDFALLPFDLTNCMLKFTDHQTGPWPFAECGQPFRGAYTDSPNPVGFEIDYRDNDLQRILCNDGSWLIQGRPGLYRLSGHVQVDRVGPQAFDLEFRATHPAIPLSGNGLMHYGGGYRLAYYVRPKIDMSGTLQRGMAIETVTGSGWFERQWGAWPGDRFGWTYLNLHLETGEQWLVYASQRNGYERYYAACFPRDGGVEEYDLVRRQFQPMGSRDHRSGSKVMVNTPDGTVTIYVEPLHPDDDDLHSDLPGMPSIWEGVSEVTCRLADGTTVAGIGLTEIKPYE